MMRKICASLLLAIGLLGTAQAQTTRDLALKLSETMVDQSFKDLKPLLDMAFSNLEKQVSGNKDRTLSIFVEEMKNAANRENFIQLIGEVMARDMTSGEIQEALDFMNSSAGRKFSRLSESMKGPRNLLPILKIACDRARTRSQSIGLSTAELDRACAQFQ